MCVNVWDTACKLRTRMYKNVMETDHVFLNHVVCKLLLSLLKTNEIFTSKWRYSVWHVCDTLVIYGGAGTFVVMFTYGYIPTNEGENLMLVKW